MTPLESRTDGILSSSVEGAVGWIILDNPARHNAMSLSMWARLADLIGEFEANDTVRCVVMRGVGEKAFCAGADISEFEQTRSDRDANLEYDRIAKSSLVRLQRMPKPSIAMISGYCIGGGVALAISCDLRIADSGSRYGIPAAKLGLGYDLAGLRRLSTLVGPSRAKHLMFTADRFSAEDAARMGLIDEVTEAGALEERTRAMASTIAGNAPLTIAAAKLAVDLDVAQATPEDRDAVSQRIQMCFDSEDFIEGRRAFMEKRPPAFKGR